MKNVYLRINCASKWYFAERKTKDRLLKDTVAFKSKIFPCFLHFTRICINMTSPWRLSTIVWNK